MEFVHLQVRSAYSFHFGPCTVEKLVAAAAGLGQQALALTDIDSLYGVHIFEEACKDHGIKPIFGVELTDGQAPPRGKTPRRAVLLAANRAGFANLCRLVTQRRGPETFKLQDRVAQYRDGLVVLTDAPDLLQAWHGIVENLHGLITLRSTQAVLMARRLGLPLAASCEATLLSPEDYQTHRLLRAIGCLKPVGAVTEAELAHPNALLHGSAAVSQLFADFPDAVAHTATIAQSIGLTTLFDGFVYPSRNMPPEHNSLAELRDRVLAGATGRYGEIGDGVLNRIDYELGIINSKGFTEYFLIVADIVAKASRTCGRGSGAASIVAFCLGITNVDPIAHNLYFERFLNQDRNDPPDIDIDFAWDERDAIMQAVIDRYGAAHCARVANHLHYQPRSAFRETARAFGMPDAETTARERAANQGQAPEAADSTWLQIQAAAKRLVGLPHGLSVHSGGMVITPGPICGHAAIEQAPSATILCWEKEGTEAAGLVKIDLLGNRSLAVIRDAVANLADNGVVIDPFEWNPLIDPATQDLLARGLSIGVFYIESPAMRQLQLKTGRGDFEHIVIHSSIIRPAANRFINEYVRRLRGGEWEPLHPLLDGLLTETYGIMCYQEDISKAAIALAGFGEGDADKLRKIVSKKSPAKLKEFENRFRAGTAARDISPETTTKIWEMILSFEGYSFCKPHSASYAMVSFQSAWLKAHHGPEFIAAVLSNGGGYYTASAYISEARRMGVPVLGPDVNHSRYRYHASAGRLRVGLLAIGGLAKATADSIVESRNQVGPFHSLRDLSRRVKLGRDDMQALAEAGALDSLAGEKSRSHCLRDIVVAGREPPKRPVAGDDLFAAEGAPSFSPATPVQNPAAAKLPGAVAGRNSCQRSRSELILELKRLGFLLEHHPLVLWRDRLRTQRCIAGKDIPRHVGQAVRLVGWLVSRKGVETKHGEAMEFVSFEDETAIYETVLFPQAYARNATQLDIPQPFILQGKIQDDLGALYVDVQSLSGLGELRASTPSGF